MCIPLILFISCESQHAALVLTCATRQVMHTCAYLPISCKSDCTMLRRSSVTGDACICACLPMYASHVALSSVGALLVLCNWRCVRMCMPSACLPILHGSDCAKLRWCYATGDACMCAYLPISCESDSLLLRCK